MSHQYCNKSKSQLTSPTPAQLPAVAVSTGHIVYGKHMGICVGHMKKWKYIERYMADIWESMADIWENMEDMLQRCTFRTYGTIWRTYECHPALHVIFEFAKKLVRWRCMSLIIQFPSNLRFQKKLKQEETRLKRLPVISREHFRKTRTIYFYKHLLGISNTNL
jgi:hypothetical protein